MKRIIVIFALLLSVLFLNSCNSNQGNCPQGYYWNQALANCVPVPNGYNNNNPADPMNYWLNFQWQNSKGYVYQTGTYPYMNPFDGSDVYPAAGTPGAMHWQRVDVCTQFGSALTVFVPGSWFGEFNTALLSANTIEITYHVGNVPPTQSGQFGWQQGYILNSFKVINKKGTPCNPYYQ